MRGNHILATVLKGATLIDGTGSDPLKDALVVIEAGRIQYAGNAEKTQIPGEAEIIDLTGKTVIPGLIDAHIHMDLHGMANTYEENLVEDKLRAIRAVKEMQATLHSGITTVRNVGSVNHIDFAVKEAIESGLFEGPRILTSGKIISMTAAGNDYFLGMYREADGCDEVRKAAREQLKAGADFLKLMATGAYMNPGGVPGAPQLSRAEMAAAVEEAAKLGRKVAAHAHGKQGIIDAIEAGVATIEHGTFIDDEVIELMLDRGVYLVPTIAVGYLMLKHGSENGIPEFMLEKTRKTEHECAENLRRAIRAGVLTAFGTDAGTNYNYHGQNALELYLLVEQGYMTPLQAIESATRVSAGALGLSSETGTIERGKAADLVVVNGSLEKSLKPLLENVEAVFREGKRVR
jgi:imidazolonepropionase-like amidohydrolase